MPISCRHHHYHHVFIIPVGQNALAFRGLLWGLCYQKKNGLLDMGWGSFCGEKRPAEWWPRTDATAELDRSRTSRDCIAGRKTQALLISCNPYGQLLILLSFIVVVFLYHYLCKIHCSHYASDTTTHMKTFFKERNGE